MVTFCNTILWALSLLLAYAWVGYPLLLAWATRHDAKGAEDSTRRSALDEDNLPYVTVVLSAYNEEAVIEKRLLNITELDYPAERIDVRVGTDGCSDQTAAIARSVAADHSCVTVYEYEKNRGKVTVLRELVQESDASPRHETGEGEATRLLVFTDANTQFRSDALRCLVRHFSDPAIGGVCGKLVLSGGQPEGAYWRWETLLKTRESHLDSCLGANGSIYAIRPHLFWREIPFNTIVDDFVIGMKVREQGFRFLYDPEAIGEEALPETADEWTRRVRIGSGDYQAAVLCRRCLRLRFGWFAWAFWSHKILRWLTPHALIALTLVCLLPIALFDAWSGVGPVVLGGLGAFCILAAVGRGVRQSQSRILALPRLCEHFLTMQAALLVGFMRFCRGGLSGSWVRTPRG